EQQRERGGKTNNGSRRLCRCPTSRFAGCRHARSISHIRSCDAGVLLFVPEGVKARAEAWYTPQRQRNSACHRTQKLRKIVLGNWPRNGAEEVRLRRARFSVW